jgi:hypothetical protein
MRFTSFVATLLAIFTLATTGLGFKMQIFGAVQQPQGRASSD